MSPGEQDAFRMIECGLELLRKAIAHGDPHKELEVRVSDLIRDVQAIAWPDLKAGRDVHVIRRRPPRWNRSRRASV